MRFEHKRNRQYGIFARAMKSLGFEDVTSACPPGLDSLTAEQLLDEILKEVPDFKSSPDCDLGSPTTLMCSGPGESRHMS